MLAKPAEVALEDFGNANQLCHVSSMVEKLPNHSAAVTDGTGSQKEISGPVIIVQCPSDEGETVR